MAVLALGAGAFGFASPGPGPEGSVALVVPGMTAGLPCMTVLCATNFIEVPGLRRPASSVSAGGQGVWALDDQGTPYRYSTAARSFVAVPGVALTVIAVGGGNLVFDDEVWGLAPDHTLHTWNEPVRRWIAVAGPVGELWTSVVVGPGHNIDGCHFHEVWGLSSAQRVYRRNACNNTWENIAAGSPAAIATGGGEAWMIDAQGGVFRFDPAANAFQHIPGTLSAIAVGVDGVWGVHDQSPVLSASGAVARTSVAGALTPQVFQYDPASGAMVQVKDAALAHVSAGGSGVWGLDAGLGIWRFQGGARRFVAIPNANLRSLSVGSGTGVWGVDRNFRIRGFVTPARVVNPVNAAF